jgi:outer membrane protein OmpA-like peptidoglycan-associated protein
MIEAICDGGAAVKNSEDALRKAGQISQAVYQEQGADADYWVKYYKGVQETDKTGMSVDLGGSSVNDQADAMYDFGLMPGSADLVAATYTAFADLVHSQYANLMPSYPSANQIIDKSYLKAVMQERPLSAGQTNRPAVGVQVTPGRTLVSSKNWNIPFQTGQASFSPAARGVLERLRRDLLIASGTSVEIHGHTDNVGSPDANMKLSESRAFAVQHWLESAFPRNFPAGRVRIFAEGQTQPLVPNSSEGNRARNRRVEIILKSSQ